MKMKRSVKPLKCALTDDQALILGHNLWAVLTGNMPSQRSVNVRQRGLNHLESKEIQTSKIEIKIKNKNLPCTVI